MSLANLRREERKANLVPLTLAVGVLTSVLSLGRILIVNRDALSTLLWAEDGLFPLCVNKATLLSCWVDPFAGYLLTGPRLVAGLVAFWPMDQWPLWTNVIAAVIVGALSSWIFFIVKRNGISTALALLLSSIPVLIPIVGLEVVNSIGSMYLLLLYACSILLVLGGVRLRTWSISLLLMFTALTIPTAVLLLPVIALLAYRKRIERRTAITGSVALAAGLLAQTIVILQARSERVSGITWTNVPQWIDVVPNALLTTWPGMSSTGAFVFDRFPVPPFPYTGLAVLAVVLALSWRGWRSQTAVGESAALLIWLGIGFSLIPILLPSVSGTPGNRYFVPLVLFWCAATVIWLSARVATWPAWVPWAVLVSTLVVWWPMYPASQFRHQADPPWTSEIEQLSVACSVGGPDTPIELTFSPAWPHSDTELQEPTTNLATCSQLSGVLP